MKQTILTALFIVLANMSFAQNNTEERNKAFSESYKSETLGEYTSAIHYLKKVYSETSYPVNLRLGWLLYSAGLFTESMAYYQKCIQLMPMSLEAKFGYINPAAALGNWEQVIMQYQEILKIDPNNTKANYRLGLILYGRKDYKTAYTLFEKNINLYPFDYDSVIMFAWTNYYLGKLREAKILFQKTLLLNPNDASAKEGLSLIK